ncbi:MAG: M48 family metallopeptidase [Mitsuokella multacida]|jgi:predicted metal-dependent hydrolase
MNMADPKKKETKRQIKIAGFAVEFQRKRIKNMHLRVKAPDGRVTLSAPLRLPKTAIERFVRENEDWLRRKIAEVKQRPMVQPHPYVTGETIPLWGEPKVLVVKAGKRAVCRFEGPRVLLFLPAGENSTREQREAVLREAYRQELVRAIAETAPKIEQLTGLYAREWRTKRMKTRWGTCNILKRRIWINLELAKRRPVCLRYIILHEVIHLTERYHNKHFYALLSYYMPEWKKVRAELNAVPIVK